MITSSLSLLSLGNEGSQQRSNDNLQMILKLGSSSIENMETAAAGAAIYTWHHGNLFLFIMEDDRVEGRKYYLDVNQRGKIGICTSRCTPILEICVIQMKNRTKFHKARHLQGKTMNKILAHSKQIQDLSTISRNSLYIYQWYRSIL